MKIIYVSIQEGSTSTKYISRLLKHIQCVLSACIWLYFLNSVIKKLELMGWVSFVDQNKIEHPKVMYTLKPIISLMNIAHRWIISP